MFLFGGTDRNAELYSHPFLFFHLETESHGAAQPGLGIFFLSSGVANIIGLHAASGWSKTFKGEHLVGAPGGVICQGHLGTQGAHFDSVSCSLSRGGVVFLFESQQGKGCLLCKWHSLGSLDTCIADPDTISLIRNRVELFCYLRLPLDLACFCKLLKGYAFADRVSNAFSAHQSHTYFQAISLPRVNVVKSLASSGWPANTVAAKGTETAPVGEFVLSKPVNSPIAA